LDAEHEVADHGPVGRDRLSAGRLFRNESGATSIEHGLLACIFALVIVYAVASGFSPKTIYGRISGALADERPPVETPLPGAD
jgi:Flp pilus assembly pilin Flp